MLRGLIMDYGGVLTDGEPIRSLVRRARAAGVRTALLSDAQQVPADCAELFDVVVLGTTAGARKPDPAAFRATTDLLDLPAGDCVVVDDLPANLAGARAAGAVIVRHENPEVTVAELEILLGL
ncbi:HAD-IA family hydrolase [Pseudonocardia asaccharolytica]|uniref:Haloacid dehalogenase n=1 Tax=Pseudonocardia asaccharolytica DSM 44247 = NBRC 16224 TaxID=1123024 RepID=A0A511DA55_9PSEU|nr:HAD-IA family hydrolase [Pseudonocardia asaccharolytica]GEL19828.1 haloacid dehalogenase [Pseudonocardia asaccharolytica DSM 44247 = NBRC 16224]